MYCQECGHKNLKKSDFCQECGAKLDKNTKDIVESTPIVNGVDIGLTDKTQKRSSKKPLWIILGILAFILILAGLYKIYFNPFQRINYNQEEITASVVNIYCPSTEEGEDIYGGSGTIITTSGFVLTNSHIIPQDEKYIHVDETGCLVTLPNPQTGQIEGIYLAHPVVLPGLSDKYDLAFMEIYDAYYDEEEKKDVGIYPREFPAFDDTGRCQDEDVKLGEPIKIYGYPAISGGYSLTITDGLVSSMPGDGTIVTSAKISHGSSGGLAVDNNGCMIGVPTMVSTDDAESLGIVYSMNIVNEFLKEVTDLTKK